MKKYKKIKLHLENVEGEKFKLFYGETSLLKELCSKGICIADNETNAVTSNGSTGNVTNGATTPTTPVFNGATTPTTPVFNGDLTPTTPVFNGATTPTTPVFNGAAKPVFNGAAAEKKELSTRGAPVHGVRPNRSYRMAACIASPVSDSPPSTRPPTRKTSVSPYQPPTPPLVHQENVVNARKNNPFEHDLNCPPPDFNLRHPPPNSPSTNSGCQGIGTNIVPMSGFQPPTFTPLYPLGPPPLSAPFPPLSPSQQLPHTPTFPIPEVKTNRKVDPVLSSIERSSRKVQIYFFLLNIINL